MKLIYNVKDKPKFNQVIMFAFQQVLAIMAATIAVPASVNAMTGASMSSAEALFGAGMGTIVYQLFTKFKSPVFLGSSFAFINSMVVAFTSAAAMSMGYAGLIIGACFAALVYIILSIIVKLAGVKWIDKIMPAIVIGPTVAIIGLSLSGYAVSLMTSSLGTSMVAADNFAQSELARNLAIVCALITVLIVILCSVFGKKMARLIPFIIGILGGYAVAVIFTLIGNATGNDALKIIDFTPFKNLFAAGATFSSFIAVPNFTFLRAGGGWSQITGGYIVTLAVAFIPVAFVVFAEHLADHKNLSSIIETNLLEDPGLSRTLLGDGIGSAVGAFFGGCENTTYGESVGCVAITKNASIVSITGAAILCAIISFVAPFVAFLETIPSCVMGGVCLTLYGFIAVSGLKMIQPVDLNENKNLFVVSMILIAGIGGLSMTFGKTTGNNGVTLTSTAFALILGVITNVILSRQPDSKDPDKAQQLMK